MDISVEYEKMWKMANALSDKEAESEKDKDDRQSIKEDRMEKHLIGMMEMFSAWCGIDTSEE